MTQVVYADVLFVTNMLITYLLLSLVASVFRANRGVWRMIFASALGGLFSFYILAPEQHTLITMLIKFSFSAAIIFCGFKVGTVRRFLKLLLGFYVVSFGFAGIMIAVWIIVKPNGMVINNSVVYFNISVPLLLVSCAFCYGVIWLAQRVISKRVPHNSMCDVTICVLNVSVTCRAMIDTGNSLTDLFTGWPVIIAEYGSVERLIPVPYKAFYSCKGQLPQMTDGFSERVRATPYDVVGGGGILPAFRPDYIILRNGGRRTKIENVIVAVTVNNLPQSDYQVLLNSTMSDYMA
ncbi:MAG: sigma-E processing peptidase SpoIIGA [Clostridia bacterium]|nr:sigma-E processing peptidase SpoIIGA [Clostridia bacterium]